MHHICTTFAELFSPITAGEPLFSRVRVAAPSWLGSVGQASPRRPVGRRRGDRWHWVRGTGRLKSPSSFKLKVLPFSTGARSCFRSAFTGRHRRVGQCRLSGSRPFTASDMSVHGRSPTISRYFERSWPGLRKRRNGARPAKYSPRDCRPCVGGVRKRVDRGAIRAVALGAESARTDQAMPAKRPTHCL